MIKEFVADTFRADYFKDFKITQQNFEVILKDYFQVEKEHWKHGYSHVAEDNWTGHVILKYDRKIK